MSYRMSRKKREEFLAGVHVAVLAVNEPGRGPSLSPVWYEYEPGGEVRFTTDLGTRKLRLMKESGRISLCVQLDESPYMYVSVEGPVTGIDAADVDRDMRPLAARYLGAYNGERYIESLGGEAAADNSVLVRMRPEHWYTADYS